MKWNSLVARMAVLLLFTACGKNATEVFTAPQTQEQAGLIASCASIEEAQALAKKYSSSFRVISAKQKLIEFYAVSEKDIKSIIPKAKIKKNLVFESLLSDSKITTSSVSNLPYYGPHTNYPTLSRTHFSHLEQINARTDNKQGEGIIIAIVDTGVYYNHPHLSPNILTNTADPHGAQANGQDDDGNRFADDYVGWDFYNGDAYPIDDHGHGTHVAGLAAGVIGGIATKAKILPVKVMSETGRGDIATIAAGILYAIQRGAHIINLSLGGPKASMAQHEIQELLSSVRFSEGHDGLIVAAAGNGGNDGIGDCNDASPIFPAGIESDNILSVAAVDGQNKIASYSNYGTLTVDLAAPGGAYTTGGLLSTAIPYCNGPCKSDYVPYVSMSGTSMASPVAAGVAAVVKSERPSMNAVQLKDHLMQNSSMVDSLVNRVKNSGVINLQSALDHL